MTLAGFVPALRASALRSCHRTRPEPRCTDDQRPSA
jgi:hypothetical protein